jgi:hypothetical protein
MAVESKSAGAHAACRSRQLGHGACMHSRDWEGR